MTDSIHDGWNTALTVLGWTIGALIPIVVVALIVFGGYVLAQTAQHRLRVHRLRRQTRASGRR